MAKVAAVALLSLVAACGGDGGGTEPRSVAGTYTLQTVNDAPLPAVLFEVEGYKLEVTGATYVLQTSGSFTSTGAFRETENGVVTTSSESFGGEYTVSGSTVTFTDSDGSVVTAVATDNSLRFSEDGMTAVFVK